MTSEEYAAGLRDARAQFRARDTEAAFLLSRDLHQKHPDVAEVEIFARAVAKSLNHLMREAARNGEHFRAMELAKLLFDDASFDSSARETYLNAAGSLLPIEAVEKLLAAIDDDPRDEPFLTAIASRLLDLPRDTATAWIALRVLRHLNGNAEALEVLDSILSPIAPETGSPDHGLTADMSAVISRLPTALRAPDRLAALSGLRVRATAVVANMSNEHALLALWSFEKALKEADQALNPAASPKPPDIWSFIEKSSPHFALDETPKLERAGELLFAAPPHSPSRPMISWVRAILSLWLQSANREASQDRIGYLWVVVDPLIHILIICLIPLLIHRGSILDMEVFPFGVIGACFWLVFRSAMMGAMSGGGVLVPQLEHPPLRRLDVIFARGLNALIVYALVAATLLIVAISLGISPLPQNLPVFLLLLIVSWLMGMGYGLIGSSLLFIYPGFRRVNGFLVRFMGLTSGLFYATEQVPEPIARVLLFNPLLHNAQLARSLWFPEYQTRDGSLLYVLTWLLVLLLLGLSLLSLDERRAQKVRA